MKSLSYIITIIAISTNLVIAQKANTEISVINFIKELKDRNQIENNPLILLNGDSVNIDSLAAKLNLFPNPNDAVFMYFDKNDEQAVTLYGNRARSGVIIIEIDEEDKEVNKKNKFSNVLILLDGKVISHEELGQINEDSIESIEVFKDKEIVRYYTKEEKEGVIIITTKKKK